MTWQLAATPPHSHPSGHPSRRRRSERAGPTPQSTGGGLQRGKYGMKHLIHARKLRRRTQGPAAAPRCRCSSPRQLSPPHQGQEEESALRAPALAQQRRGSCAQRVRPRVARWQSPAHAAQHSGCWWGSPALLLSAQQQVAAARSPPALQPAAQEQATAVRRASRRRQSVAQQAGTPTA